MQKLTEKTMAGLTAMLRSSSESTRLVAIRLLADANPDSIKEILEPLALKDRNPAVRFLARRVLRIRSGSPMGFGDPWAARPSERPDPGREPPRGHQLTAPGFPLEEPEPAVETAASPDDEPTVASPGSGSVVAPVASPAQAVPPVDRAPQPPPADRPAPGPVPPAGAAAQPAAPPAPAPEPAPAPPHPADGPAPQVGAPPDAAGESPESEDEWVRLRRAALSVLKPCIRQLTDLVDCEDANVRAEAALALGRLKATESYEQIHGLLRVSEPDERIVKAVGELGDPRGVDALVRLYRDAHWKTLQPAVCAAVARIRSAQAEDFLRKALSEEDLAIQNIVVKYVAQSGNERFVEPLLARLGHVEDYFEIGVIQALSRFSATHPRVPQVFLSRLAREGNPRLVACLLAALTDVKDSTLVDVLDRLARHRDRRVRANAVEAVSRLSIGPAIKIRILRPLLSDDDNRVRANAAKALYELGDRSAFDVIKTMLSNRDKWWRASACYALGACNPPGTVAMLAKSLRDADVDVRINATKALKDLDDPHVGPHLLAMVGDKNLWIRVCAIETLGNMRLRAANPTLRATLRSETNLQVLATALLAAGKTGTPEGSGVEIGRYVTHVGEKVRLAAVEAMEYVLTPDNMGTLLPALRDADRRVRAAAVRALFRFGQVKVISTLYESLLGGAAEEQQIVAFCLGEVADVIQELESQSNIDRLIDALRRVPAYSQGGGQRGPEPGRRDVA